MFPLGAGSSKTTSIHSLNADRGLRRYQRPLYLLLNWANNLFPYTGIDPRLVTRDFTCADPGKHWGETHIKSSPSRKLSDLFWLHLPWEEIHGELGEIHLVDIGCGTGKYGAMASRWAGGKVASYTGIDTNHHEEWASLKAEHPNFRFLTADSKAFAESIPENANFFMSQSAVEHFDEDLSFFRQIRDYTLVENKSVIQVHLIPSKACLRLYGLHGARQYTPRTVSKLTSLFHDFSYAVLFGLGGEECNRLHYEFITRPLTKLRTTDWRDQKTQEYDERLYSAVERDMERRQPEPSFYALVIHSNGKNELTLGAC